jgi:glutamyl-tRNA synthetase
MLIKRITFYNIIMNEKIFVLRFAPSPTGVLHIGNLRTALFCWLITRQKNGKFLLRIENTDMERSLEEYEKKIYETLEWVAINYDEKPLRQSDRKEIYKEFLQKLIDQNLVYSCDCSDGKDCGCVSKKLPISNDYGIRFKTPNDKEETFNDLILGPVKGNYKEIEDFVLQRRGGAFTYNLCVVVDDILSNITHIIRGQDHVTNTFKQILLYKAFNCTIPYFAHLPLIKTKNNEKMSKRQGCFSVEDFRKKGIVPEAIISTISRLGWGYQNQEIFTIDELITLFNIKKVQKSAACFDEEKLLHTSGFFIKNKDNSVLLKEIQNFANLFLNKDIILDITQNYDMWFRSMDSLKQRSRTLLEIINLGGFISEKPSKYIIENELMKKAILHLIDWMKKNNKEFKKDYKTTIKSLNEFIKNEITKEVSFKEFSIDMRQSLVGKTVSPPTIDIINILGFEETIKRLEKTLY